MSKKRKITCSVCNGTGQLCNCCGEAEAACECPDGFDPGECETCKGKGGN